jgi:protein TonB
MKPVLYRPAPKGPVAVAFALAAVIHVSALAFAPIREPVALSPSGAIPYVDAFETEPDQPIPPESRPLETPIPATVDQPNDFTDSPEPSSRIQLKTIKPFRQTHFAPSRNPSGNAKLFALNAPRPAYPYEARRDHLTGSGMALLNVNSANGSVLNARIIQSTGSPILDNSALSAFRRWRFRAGSPPQVKVPFTFTMSGAQL